MQAGTGRMGAGLKELCISASTTIDLTGVPVGHMPSPPSLSINPLLRPLSGAVEGMALLSSPSRKRELRPGDF